MKIFYKISRPRVYILASAIGAFVFYFLLQFIIEFEKIVAGETAGLQIGGGRFIADTSSAHWLGLLVWLVVILSVILWRAGLLESVRDNQAKLHRMMEAHNAQQG